ncbi:MAG: hypothetical protein DRI39_06860, partial [Chloroflexi bacterium]
MQYQCTGLQPVAQVELFQERFAGGIAGRALGEPVRVIDSRPARLYHKSNIPVPGPTVRRQAYGSRVDGVAADGGC